MLVGRWTLDSGCENCNESQLQWILPSKHNVAVVTYHNILCIFRKPAWQAVLSFDITKFFYTAWREGWLEMAIFEKANAEQQVIGQEKTFGFSAVGGWHFVDCLCFSRIGISVLQENQEAL